MISQMLGFKFAGNVVVNLLGVWRDASGGRGAFPIGGLCSYLSPPETLGSVLTDLIHAILYTTFILRTWLLQLLGYRVRFNLEI